MDDVPYPQALAGPEPQYVLWGVLLVRSIGPQTPEVGSLACVSCGPLSSRPPLSLCGLWRWVSRLFWLGCGGGGGGAAPRHSWPNFLCACPRHSWLRVLGVAPRHSWLRYVGLWGVVVAGGHSLPAEGPGWVFPRQSWLRAPGAVPRHSWLGDQLVLVVGGHSWVPFPAAAVAVSVGLGGGFPVLCVFVVQRVLVCVLCVCGGGVGVGVSSVCFDVRVCACVVCGGWFPRLGLAAGVGVGVAGVCCGWSLTTPGGGS